MSGLPGKIDNYMSVVEHCGVSLGHHPGIIDYFLNIMDSTRDNYSTRNITMATAMGEEAYWAFLSLYGAKNTSMGSF